ncbi:TPA: hypothetical protein RZL14_002255 [Yersinia enterocolitica]|nr:hypothetical protein [Yersinia enterocolitica]
MERRTRLSMQILFWSWESEELRLYRNGVGIVPFAPYQAGGLELLAVASSAFALASADSFPLPDSLGAHLDG